jgi:hypothetical protein
MYIIPWQRFFNHGEMNPPPHCTNASLQMCESQDKSRAPDVCSAMQHEAGISMQHTKASTKLGYRRPYHGEGRTRILRFCAMLKSVCAIVIVKHDAVHWARKAWHCA